ncbi:MAG: MaoC family dehydratase [Kaiparowitsia implicata GSE-PSE-MK54-09C]|jgi:acyl dehydratase|nr:MaoC family dehydratase [Kaiparowitsia implicata GSE-PSE-MK54-09C]
MSVPSTSFPLELKVHVLLGHAPHYRGSIHDDDVARERGYKAALVPGAFIYGHISRLAINAWGQDWAAHGAMSARFRRPVYNHEDITVRAGPLLDEGNGSKALVVVRNEEGETVAEGWIAMPHRHPEPPVASAAPLLPTLDNPVVVAAGGLQAGLPLRSRKRVLTREMFESSLADFDETHAIYRDRDFVHSGMLMRLAMGDTNSTWKLPGPFVLVSTETQHFGMVRAGQQIRFGGHVIQTFERKGRHYLVTEELLFAESTVAARFLRTQIYG